MTAIAGFRTGRVRVPVVDDEPALTDLLCVAVEEPDRRAYPALDGRSALRIARGCPPHAAVLDEMLPDLDDLVLAEKSREVHRDGVPVQLTAKEFDLLSLMMDHPRQVLSKARILDRVWSGSSGGGNLVEVRISSLRRKIDKGRAPVIHTVHGLGYIIRPVEDGR
ncbi:DNA-binding response regulator [Streptomyces sp. NPDC056479]|uniref:response regulator transcription factor n=1 Tax=Streptomyces sp. NPDC056479 TaxID=3345832 RepID=UPI0036800468